MRIVLFYIACIVPLLLLASILPAQRSRPHFTADARNAGPPVEWKASVDKQKILIGEPVKLTLEATVSGAAPVTWPTLDTLPHFDWLDKGKLDSAVHPDGRYFRQVMTVTSFDSGAWAIPRLPLLAGNRSYFTDSLRVEIVFTNFDASKDYHDIREIIDVPNPFAKWIPWIVAFITLAALALVIWLMGKKKLLVQIVQALKPVPRLPPYEEAMKQLDELQQQHLPETGAIKAYYTRLNDILRHFVARRLAISSLSETNEELISQLRQLPIDKSRFSDMAETLRLSDFVKFAKYIPGSSDNERSFETIRTSVEVLQEVARARESEAVQKQAAQAELRKAAEAARRQAGNDKK